MILPTFFPFLGSCDHTCPSVLMPPTHVPHHMPSNHGTHPHLYRTYMHHSICPHPYLVLVSCAKASYHIPMTCSSLTHLPPFWYYTVSLLGMLSDPHHASDTLYLRLCFTYSISNFYMTHTFHPYYVSSPSCFLDLVLYLAMFHLCTQIQT